MIRFSQLRGSRCWWRSATSSTVSVVTAKYAEYGNLRSRALRIWFLIFGNSKGLLMTRRRTESSSSRNSSPSPVRRSSYHAAASLTSSSAWGRIVRRRVTGWIGVGVVWRGVLPENRPRICRYESRPGPHGCAARSLRDANRVQQRFQAWQRCGPKATQRSRAFPRPLARQSPPADLILCSAYDPARVYLLEVDRFNRKSAIENGSVAAATRAIPNRRSTIANRQCLSAPLPRSTLVRCLPQSLWRRRRASGFYRGSRAGCRCPRSRGSCCV